MGFSLIAATAIIGVSILMSIEIMVGTTIPAITDMHNSFEKMRDRAIDQVQTDINITGLQIELNGTNYDINITVENTGSVTLETVYFDVLINGTKIEFTCSESYLYPNDSALFNILNLSGSGEKKVKIVTNNGVSDYHEFSLP